jgi:hypothetical protein
VPVYFTQSMRQALFSAALCLSAMVVLPGSALAGLKYQFQEDHLESFQFELSRSVRTERVGFELLQPFSTRVMGTVQRYVARIFRDGSLGVVVRTMGLDGSIKRVGMSETKLDLSAVEGRSVSLRLDRGGAQLDSTGWLHLRRAGAGDLLDEVLLGSAPRLPARIPAHGELVAGSYRIALPIDKGVSCQQTWVLSYSRVEEQLDACSGSCCAVAYEGTVRENCMDRASALERSGVAKVTGQLEINVLGVRSRVRAHRWIIDWERRLATTQSVEEIIQHLRAEGSLVAEENP